jgi:hypothetical protein
MLLVREATVKSDILARALSASPCARPTSSELLKHIIYLLESQELNEYMKDPLMF